MNKSVYIESSVISYLTARPSRDLVIAGHQAVTADWWDDHRMRYDAYVSPLVVEEISAGDASAAAERLRVIADVPSVAIGAEAESLALALLAANAVPANSTRDALHIAIAATPGDGLPCHLELQAYQQRQYAYHGGQRGVQFWSGLPGAVLTGRTDG